jgi:hypothetical protein
MKKLIGLLAFLLIVALPFAAGATLITNVTLVITKADYTTLEKESFVGYTPSSGSALDYDVTSSTYPLLTDDAFCVENKTAPTSAVYDFISLDLLANPAYQAAANIAQAYSTGLIQSILGATVTAKDAEDATQIAVWETFFDYGKTPDLTKNMFRASGYLDSYVNTILSTTFSNTNNWYLAVSPESSWSWSGDKIVIADAVPQNYLVKVPEPTQMLLLGTALIGLAGIGRKKFFKK